MRGPYRHVRASVVGVALALTSIPAGASAEPPGVTVRPAAAAAAAAPAGMTRVTVPSGRADDLPDGSVVYESDLLDRVGHAVVDVPAGAAAALGAVPVARMTAHDAAEPNDRLYRRQFELHPEVGINAPGAWSRATGDGTVVVAVVDSGVARTHPDLVGRTMRGFNTIAETTDTRDDFGHGTFVAGQIGAVAHNRQFVTGLCWRCRILPVKVLDHLGRGWSFDIAEGIVWAVDHGADVINLSLGGPQPTPDVEAAVDYAERAGVFVVASAGNLGTTQRNYPAAFEPVVSVAATAPRQPTRLDTYSNHGDWVDVAAPGTAVSLSHLGGITVSQGTSMAAPLVSATAALALTLDPDLDPDALRRTLFDTAKQWKLRSGTVRTGAVDSGRWLDRAVSPKDVPAQPPVLRFDDARVLPGVKTVIRVLSNDQAPLGHRFLTVSLEPEGRPSAGTMIARDGVIVYTAPERGVLAGLARYRVCTAQGACGVGAIRLNPLTIGVKPPSQPLPARAKVLVGDFNGDGVDTPAVFVDGHWKVKLRLGHGRFERSFRFGRRGDVPVVGDWNGDGRDTIGVVRGNLWILADSLGQRGIRTFRFGRRTDQPIVGDFNGDGRTEHGVRRGNRYFLAGRLGGTAVRLVRHGMATDEALVGDFNGDGRDLPQAYRRARRFWILKDAPGRRITSWRHPVRGVPIIGDWDGDGRDDVGFVSAGRWALRLTPEPGAADVVLHLTRR